ncbi:MAG: nucleoside triphosphate pyrophosphohydrolase [Henriciella sp.]|nr:nucleoside triphosphate pyrophosphohydrolase [Henriciella sp.]
MGEANGNGFDQLVAIMAQLRNPDGGCAWDLEQSFETIAPYTLEEAYEVVDAIQRKDMDDLCDELGDLLLQVVFHAQMASEAGAFSIADVIVAICDKMIRRHPHVFGTDVTRSADEQTVAWEAMKAEERKANSSSKDDASALAGVAIALPALVRSEKLQKRAARTGFDWTEPEQIFDKLDEEIQEVKTAIEEEDPDSIEDEIGDVLFVCANLARRFQVDPEVALTRSNRKFERRFRDMEVRAAALGLNFSDLDLDAQERLWGDVKSVEKAKS